MLWCRHEWIPLSTIFGCGNNDSKSRWSECGLLKAVYHLLNFCYSNHILFFPNGNIVYRKWHWFALFTFSYSIRMDQDKKCSSSLEESKNLITLENDSFIDSFKNEQLVLFNEEDDMIAFTFLITDDKVEGNGRVLLHIRPASHASSDVRSLAALSSLPITLGVPNSILARTSIHVPSLSHPTHTFSPSSPSDSDPSLQDRKSVV